MPLEFSWPLFLWQTILFISFIFTTYCLVNILKRKFELKTRIILVLVVLLLPIIGSIIYFIMVRKSPNKLI
jgi:hypothetical protein